MSEDSFSRSTLNAILKVAEAKFRDDPELLGMIREVVKRYRDGGSRAVRSYIKSLVEGEVSATAKGDRSRGI